MTSSNVVHQSIMPVARGDSFVELKKLKFLITDRPQPSTLDRYIETLKARGVTHVVRVCDPSYSIDKLVENGIQVHDWPYADGDPPPQEVIDGFLALVEETFKGDEDDNGVIAVHCVAGLGRAPVMVAIALIEEGGVSAEDAVLMIREVRRGAINSKQIEFLQAYKPRKKKKAGWKFW